MIKLQFLFLPFWKSILYRWRFNNFTRWVIFYLCIIPSFLSAQSYQWAKAVPTDFIWSYELLNSQVCYTQNDQVYWVYLSDAMENYGQAFFGSTNLDVYSPEGVLESSQQITGKVHVQRFLDAGAGEIYMLLNTRGDIVFSDGETLPYNGDGIEISLVKVSAGLELLWAVDLSSPFAYGNSPALATDDAGNVYAGQNVDFGSRIIKYDPNGNELMAVDQTDVPLISSIDIDSEGNILFAGSCADAGASYGGVLIEPATLYNYFVGKYNAQFEIQWVNYLEDVTCQFPEVKCQDPDYIYFSGGLFMETVFGNLTVNGPQWVYDFFVAQLNSNGEYQWVHEVPEVNTIQGDAFIGKHNFCAVDENDNFYWGGFIRGTIDWGNGVVIGANDFGNHMLTLRFNTEGAITSGKVSMGEGFQEAFSISTGENGDWYVAGSSIYPMSLGEINITTDGTFPFLTKINAGGTTTGVSDLDEFAHFQIVPNPANNSINFQTDLIYPNARISIFDQAGKSVLETSQNLNESLDIENLPSGLYFVRIGNSKQTPVLRKIIKL